MSWNVWLAFGKSVIHVEFMVLLIFCFSTEAAELPPIEDIYGYVYPEDLQTRFHKRVICDRPEGEALRR